MATWFYLGNVVRCRKWKGRGDVRAYRPALRWTARADLVDVHPVTGKPLKRSEWWIFERKGGHGHV